MSRIKNSELDNKALTEFVSSLRERYGNKNIDRTMLNETMSETKNSRGYRMFTTDETFKVSRGVYSVATKTEVSEQEISCDNPTLSIKIDRKEDNSSVDNLIPPKDKTFVPFGDFNLISNFISSGQFYPIYITGESGNGKTKMVYEACAKQKRELIRANITEMTDEDDLIGHYNLQNGETVWTDGPVIKAMKRGAILLLDEINLGTPKIMCLQPVLEGNPIFVKKTNTYVMPAEGFNVIATANTKGKGADDGRYMGSQVLNEALLDRFAVTIEHDYPSKSVETNILKNILKKNNVDKPEVIEFVELLVNWADMIRNTFKQGAIDEIITTRRLIHIMNFYMYGKEDRMKSIQYCISRFDEDTKQSMLSLYQKVDETIKLEREQQEASNKEKQPPDNINISDELLKIIDYNKIQTAQKLYGGVSYDYTITQQDMKN